MSDLYPINTASSGDEDYADLIFQVAPGVEVQAISHTLVLGLYYTQINLARYAIGATVQPGARDRYRNMASTHSRTLLTPRHRHRHNFDRRRGNPLMTDSGRRQRRKWGRRTA